MIALALQGGYLCDGGGGILLFLGHLCGKRLCRRFKVVTFGGKFGEF